MRHIAIRLFSIILVLTLFAGLAACKSAPIQISDLNISPARIAIGEKSSISASLYNPNKGEEKYSATLKVNDAAVETKETILAGGEKKTVDFSYSASSTGTFKIELNGLIDNLSVSKPPEFQVTSLDVSPAEVIENSPVTISAEIKNIGEVEGAYSAKLNVDGVEISAKNVIVGIESPEKAEFTTNLSISGSHTLEVGGISKTITVLRQAELLVNSIKVTPNKVFPGQDALVEALVTNTGEVKGSFSIPVTVNGLETDSKLVSIEPGKTDTVSFKVNRDAVGEFELGVQNQKAVLKVMETKSYTSPKYLYSISYPLIWTLNDEKPEAVSIERDQEVYANVYYFDIPVEITQKLLTDIIIANNKNVMPQLEVLPSTVQQYSSLNATRIEYSYSKYGMFARGNFVILKQETHGYVIIVESLAIDWEKNFQLIDAFIKSFKPPK